MQQEEALSGSQDEGTVGAAPDPEWKIVAELAARRTLENPPPPGQKFTRLSVLHLGNADRLASGTYQQFKEFAFFEMQVIERWRDLVLTGCGRWAQSDHAGSLVLLSPRQSVKFAEEHAWNDVAQALKKAAYIVRNSAIDEMSHNDRGERDEILRRLGQLRGHMAGLKRSADRTRFPGGES